MASEEKGVWRTIGGRRVFIKDGQSLADAMIESGKFKNDLRTSYRKAKEEDAKKKEELKQKSFESGEEGYKAYQEYEKMRNESKKEAEKSESIKGSEDKERLEIAKEIAKEVYGKNMGEELLERKAREILEPQEGEVLEEGDKPYTNAKGELERSTKYLKEWQEQLKGSKEEPKLSEKQIEAGNKLKEKSVTNAINDIKQYLGGDRDNWDSNEDFVRDLASEYNLDKEEAQNLFKNVSEQEKQSKSTKSSGNQVTNSLQQKAYEKYKREHPNSKLTFEQFKKEQD